MGGGLLGAVRSIVARSALVAVAAAVIGVSACSSDDPVPEARPAAATSSTLVGGPGTIATSTVPAGDQTTEEAAVAAGLTAEEARCVSGSGVDGEFETTLPTAPDGPTVLTSEDATVSVPAAAATGVDLERILLGELAGDCASAAAIDRLAVSEGAALDAEALEIDLPERLTQRREVEATEDELACLDREFRRTPVRLSSLVADPRSVEIRCVSLERLIDWRKRSLVRGLQQAGATGTEALCFIDSAEDLAAISDIVDAVQTGGAPSVDPATLPTACAPADRLLAIGVAIAGGDVDFGAETLVG